MMPMYSIGPRNASFCSHFFQTTRQISQQTCSFSRQIFIRTHSSTRVSLLKVAAQATEQPRNNKTAVASGGGGGRGPSNQRRTPSNQTSQSTAPKYDMLIVVEGVNDMKAIRRALNADVRTSHHFPRLYFLLPSPTRS